MEITPGETERARRDALAEKRRQSPDSAMITCLEVFIITLGTELEVSEEFLLGLREGIWASATQESRSIPSETEEELVDFAENAKSILSNAASLERDRPKVLDELFELAKPKFPCVDYKKMRNYFSF